YSCPTKLYPAVNAPENKGMDKVRLILLLARQGLTVAVIGPGSVAAASIVYSSYLGGSYSESARGIAVDGAGNAYVVATTVSPDFPTTTGRPLENSSAAYVAKFSPQGALVYSTLVSGPCETQGNAIAVDASGHAYITGRAGLCQAEGSVAGVLVAKLDPTGALVYRYTF